MHSLQRSCQQSLPDGSPQCHFCHQSLPDGASERHLTLCHSSSAGRSEATSQRRSCQLSLPHGASQRRLTVCQSSSAARSEVTSQRRSCQLSLHDGSLPQCPLLAASAGCPYQQLRHGAPASNKPHQAEKNTPVWLAIWRIWAGFANSQHRDAAFATPGNICAHSSLLPH